MSYSKSIAQPSSKLDSVNTSSTATVAMVMDDSPKQFDIDGDDDSIDSMSTEDTRDCKVKEYLRSGEYCIRVFITTINIRLVTYLYLYSSLLHFSY